MRWKNFSVWRGKLPHWRADEVTYFVTFRHSRLLDERERAVLFAHLLRAEGRKWRLSALLVLADRTELIFTVQEGPTGRPYELSRIVEAAKRRAGSAIVKKTGERWPPFYGESYDRIIRDEDELKDRIEAILAAPGEAGLSEGPESFSTLYFAREE